jgi:hypothetical protein
MAVTLEWTVGTLTTSRQCSRIVLQKFSNTINGKLVGTAETRHGINPNDQQALPEVSLYVRFRDVIRLTAVTPFLSDRFDRSPSAPGSKSIKRYQPRDRRSPRGGHCLGKNEPIICSGSVMPLRPTGTALSRCFNSRAASRPPPPAWRSRWFLTPCGLWSSFGSMTRSSLTMRSSRLRSVIWPSAWVPVWSHGTSPCI